jgi:protoheme IX farnesyltransferase
MNPSETLKAAMPQLEAGSVSWRERAGVWLELFKVRLTSLVLLTTAAGYYLGSTGGWSPFLLLSTLMGTALVAGGAAALNQLLERDHDARMRRTQDRPLPTGRLRPSEVLAAGVLSVVAGVAWLALGVNVLTAGLGAATCLLYVFVYTPLKRITPLNTLVGAIPGAVPPLMGWAAVRGTLDPGGWALFAILAFWQLPHFLAIAWIYREDYARAGFAMVSRWDPDGRVTSTRALAHTFGLVSVSLAPVALGLTGVLYLVGALLLGAVFVFQAARFARVRSPERARSLFLASILYLPGLLVLLGVGKTG